MEQIGTICKAKAGNRLVLILNEGDEDYEYVLIPGVDTLPLPDLVAALHQQHPRVKLVPEDEFFKEVRTRRPPPYEGLPLSEESKRAASRRYIEIWTRDMDPFQQSQYVVFDANTSFSQPATEETLESVVRQAINESDRLWGPA